MIKMTLKTLTKSDIASSKGIIYTKDTFENAIEDAKEKLENGGIKLTIPSKSNLLEIKPEDILATVVDIRDGEIDIEIEQDKNKVLQEYINNGYVPAMNYLGKRKDIENGTYIMSDIKLISFILTFNKKRGFEKINSRKDENLIMPQAQTKNSAGYDFFIQENIEIKSNLPEFISAGLKSIYGFIFHKDDIEHFKDVLKPTIIKTGIKAYMLPDEYLSLFVRSSTPKNFGLVMPISVGIVDSDYYSNEENDGEIGFIVYNLFPWTVKIKKGERIGQGIFQKFLKTDDDNRLTKDRVGGTGSTSTEDNKEEYIKYMTFKEAFGKMKYGSKIKLPSWSGYWAWEDNTIKMYCKENIDPGYTSPMDIRQTQRVEYTIDNILTDKWIIADETNCPLLGGIAIMDEDDAFKYIKRGLKVKCIGKNQWIFDE